MDRILSARVDEAVHRQIGLLARKLGTSKKAVIERAVTELAASLDEEGLDPLQLSCGAWHRHEEPEEIVDHARQAFRDEMLRHHR
jgi:predicted transcriptional regulator